MRIVTDGREYAVVRRRWIFMQFYDYRCNGWSSRVWKLHRDFPMFYWMPTRNRAEEVLERLKRKKYSRYWDV